MMTSKLKPELEFFSRQLSVPDWYQPLIEQQRALVLGVGGIGCTVAKELWYNFYLDSLIDFTIIRTTTRLIQSLKLGGGHYRRKKKTENLSPLVELLEKNGLKIHTEK